MFVDGLKKRIGVLNSENELVVLIFLFNFLQGVTGLILSTIPFAMFLSRFSGEGLSYVYMISGILSLVIGLIFNYISKNYCLYYILQTPLVFLLISILFFWGNLVADPSDWVYFALVIIKPIFGMLSFFVLLRLINKLFSLQQGKKFFGIIFAGYALGATSTGLLSNWLSLYLNPTSFILIAGIFIALSMGIIYLIKGQCKEKFFVQNPIEEIKYPFSVTKSSNKHYIFLCFVAMVLLNFCYYTLDMLFNIETKRYYVSESEIAAFLGFFYGALNIVNFLVCFFMMKSILEKFGWLSLLLMSLVISGALVVLHVLALKVFHLEVVSFWILAFTVFFYYVRVYSLHLPFFFMLRQQEITWAEINQRMIVGPLAAGFIGVSLTFNNYFLGASFSELSFLFLLLTMVTIFLFGY